MALVLRISFEASWSAAFAPDLQYEVQVDELGKRWRTADSYIVLDATLSKTAMERSSGSGGAITVWVRSVTNTRVGRFVRSVCRPTPG